MFAEWRSDIWCNRSCGILILKLQMVLHVRYFQGWEARNIFLCQPVRSCISDIIALYKRLQHTCVRLTLHTHGVLCNTLISQSRNWEGLLKQMYQIQILFCSFTESTFISRMKHCSFLRAHSLWKSPVKKSYCFMPVELQVWCNGDRDKSKAVSCYWMR